MAIVLLRHSFAIPKLLQTSPCFLSTKLKEYDSLLRSIFSKIQDDSAWLQVTLPIMNGGIRIRRATLFAPSAYLASAAACSELVSTILPSHLRNISNPHLDVARSLWSPRTTPCLLQKVQVSITRMPGTPSRYLPPSPNYWKILLMRNSVLASWQPLHQNLEHG